MKNEIQQYKPSTKTVLSRIVSDTFSSRTVQKLTRGSLMTVRSLGYFIGYTVSVTGMAVAVTTVPYLIPTAVRKSSNLDTKETTTDDNVKKKLKWWEPKNNFEDGFALTGCIIGGVAGLFCGVGGQIEAYIALYDAGHPEALFLPVATNLCSGIYEVGRAVYKKTEKKIIGEDIPLPNNTKE